MTRIFPQFFTHYDVDRATRYLQYLKNKNKQKVKQNQEMFRKTLWKLDIVEN